MNPNPFIPRTQARAEYLGGISADTAKRWQDAGKLPPITRLSAKVQGWTKFTLDKWLADRQGVAQ